MDNVYLKMRNTMRVFDEFFIELIKSVFKIISPLLSRLAFQCL